MLGLGAYVGSAWSYLAAAVGVLASGACSLVGVFPMNYIEPHMVAAMSFFRFGMVAIALFSLAIVLDRKRGLPRWLALPGAVTTLTFAAFMYAPSKQSSGATTQALNAGLSGRPPFWLARCWSGLRSWPWWAGWCGYRCMCAGKTIHRFRRLHRWDQNQSKLQSSSDLWMLLLPMVCGELSTDGERLS